jgi:adenylosuccinate synthase
VAGLGFGGEGKGSVVDALVTKHNADLVVRYNGGAQCAHNVVTPSGIHHTFAQFGSGTFSPICRTYLSRFVLINPGTMLVEEQDLGSKGITTAWDRMYVDEQAVVITPFQISLNRLQELSRGDARHGSTGMGIGVTREHHLKYGARVLTVSDLSSKENTKKKLEFIRNVCLTEVKSLRTLPSTIQAKEEVFRIENGPETTSWVMGRYDEWLQKVNICSELPHYNNVVFEGGQGVMLDENYGFQPYTTWSDTTFSNAFTLLHEIKWGCNLFPSKIFKVGVLRSYYTRHGAGPFPSENPLVRFDEPHNTNIEYTGSFRKGDFDLSLAIKAIRIVNGVDFLAINHMDVFRQQEYMNVRLSAEEIVTIKVKNFLPMLTEVLGAPIGIVGYGPSFSDKEFR